MTRVMIIGATGLVGQSVLQQALDHAQVTKVIALTRRPLLRHAKLENPIVDFDALPSEVDWWAVDSVICTLGTTMAKAGSKTAFRRVDFEYPVAVARHARERGARAYALNSALGADPKSKVFYSRTKGEVEVALRELGFPSLTIVRPGMIGGNREENRFAEAMALKVTGLLHPLLPRRYRTVPAERIAKVLLEAAIGAADGTVVVESEDI